MLIKGKNLHILPDGEGWCVVDEVDQAIVLHFATRQEALLYANEKACYNESSVLIHTTQCHQGPLSSVPLPQRQNLLGQAQPLHCERYCSDFDPFLGFDEYYFEI
jgi:hypothetical protein